MNIDIRKLKIAMARKQYNAPALAEKLNVTKQTISSILNGTRNPSLKMLGRLATALEVDVTELIEN
jgi:transcriptional regulator with XRE-family HTH domain